LGNDWQSEQRYEQLSIEAVTVVGTVGDEIYIRGDGADMCQTDLYFGGRQGRFNPYRQLIVSKRLFEAMRQNKITKVEFEIVALV
jgi:hypothetical protein